LSRQKAAGLAVRIAILGGAAVTVGVYGGHAMRPSRAVEVPAAASSYPAEPQIPNRAAKTNRLPIQTALAAAEIPTYSPASVAPTVEFDRIYDPANVAAPATPSAEPPRAEAPRAPRTEAKHAALPAPPVLQDKPKRLPPPPPPPSVLLDDTQIAGIKARLRLTSDQAEYWPAVETALRDVVRIHLRTDHMSHSRGGKANIDANSPEVQRLVWAAMPLLMRLREDQKREVRKLARVIGLESVASQI